jgi:hypothetical protein
MEKSGKDSKSQCLQVDRGKAKIFVRRLWQSGFKEKISMQTPPYQEQLKQNG